MPFFSFNSARTLPAWCVLGCLVTSGKVLASDSCTSPNWKFEPSGNLYNSANEIALLNGGAPDTYGYVYDESGNIVFRQCELTQRDKVVKIPVFMVDWADYNPATDSSNPNNPDAQPITDYQPRTVEEVSQFLNHSEKSVAKYFRDISGGRIQLEFVVFGWIRSSDENAVLKNRQHYISLNDEDQRYYCNRGQIFKDALTDAYLKHGFLPQNFDVNANSREHNELLMNGAVLLYEGGPGLCSGTNMSTVDGLAYYPPGVVAEQAVLFPFSLNELARDDAPETSIFENINANLRVYNNIPETDVDTAGMYSWTHELGHLLLGFDDYYYEQYNMGYYALSAQPAETHLATHPSAVEKWLFAKWLSPIAVQDDGQYTLTSHDIADGADYVVGSHYLHKHAIDDSDTHFLLIENRWFDSDGNTRSTWAKTSTDQFRKLESGLQITEVNLTYSIFDVQPHLKRLTKTAEIPDALMAAWQQGDSFYQCFSNNYCVWIDTISGAAEQVSYRLTTGSDVDADSMPDSWEVQFGLDANNAADAAEDKDADGLSNAEEFSAGTKPDNTDSDADGMSDGWEVQYGLNPTDASDASLDSDNDGLSNVEEFNAATKPDNADTDGDGMPDGWEVQYGLNPLDASDANSDSDGDGFSALQEYQKGTNPKVSDKTNTETAASSSSGGGVSAWLLLLLGTTLFQRYRTNR